MLKTGTGEVRGRLFLQAAPLFSQWIALPPKSRDIGGEEKVIKARMLSASFSHSFLERDLQNNNSTISRQSQIVPLEPLEWSLL